MPSRQLSANQLQEIRNVAAQWGKIIARRAFGEQGPGSQVDFQAMEAIARAAAVGLAEGTLAVLLAQQADSFVLAVMSPAWMHRNLAEHVFLRLNGARGKAGCRSASFARAGSLEPADYE